MANPTCTSASLAETSPGFGLQGLNPRQYKAAKLYLMALELAALGGTDYTSVMTSTLVSDAATLAQRMDPNQRRIALLQIYSNNADAAGATVPSTFNDLNEATGCCFQAENVDFEAIELLLLCKLGVHKAYPQ